MRFVAYDSETVPFGPGDMAPQLVCIQIQPLDTVNDPSTRRIITRRAGAIEYTRRLLRDPGVTLVGHNIAYDMAVLCREGLVVEVFAAYAAGRIMCTWVYERLGEIAGFTFRKNLALDAALKAHGLPEPALKDAESPLVPGRKLSQDFARFFDAPDIPEPWRSYALDDCLVGKLFLRQTKRYYEDVPLDAVRAFSRTMFWLQLMSVWGLRADADLTEMFAADVSAKLAELYDQFTIPEPYAGWIASGRRYSSHVREYALEYARSNYLFLRPDGSCLVKDVLLPTIERAYGGGAAVPRTPTGQAQASALVLEESGDPQLEAFATYKTLVKADSTDVPMLRRGWLHPRYGLADTGRTTCGNPNVQNLPGDGLVRQAIRPADGWCFLERDYSGVELCTFAAVVARTTGDTEMVDYINAAGDPGYLHAVVGGQLLGCSPEELLRRRKAGDPLAEDARTRGKNGNFGFQGGMGWKTYPAYVRKLSRGKIIITPEQSFEIYDAWRTAVPGGPKYLKWVASTERFDGTFEAVIPGSNITRRGMWYSSAANCRFQGLAAAIMHLAGWRLACACYLPGGELYGVRPAAFVHDAFVLETRVDDTLNDVDVVFERLLREAAAEVMPEVLTKSEGHAAYSLAKRVNGQKVGRVTDARGRLIPWTPKAA